MLSSASGTTLHKNFPVQCCPRRSYSWGNIAQIKTLCSVVFQAPDNNAQEKILFYVVLILWGQHGAGQNPVQCCPRGSRQHCTGKILCKILCKVFFIFMGQHGTGKAYAILSQRLHFTDNRQHCSIAPDNIAQEKIQAMFSEQHLVTPLINIHQVLHVRKKKRSYLSFTAKIG